MSPPKHEFGGFSDCRLYKPPCTTDAYSTANSTALQTHCGAIGEDANAQEDNH